MSKRLASLSTLLAARTLMAALVFFLGFSVARPTLQAQEQPAVHAVLFYSPTCPHCHEVITKGLPPLVEKYGDQLQILLINVTTAQGNALYQAAITWLQISENMRGVPTLIVGEHYLVGSVDIPAKLPALVEAGLASGGMDWPGIPGFDKVLVDMAAGGQARSQAAPTPPGAAKEAAPAQEALPAVESSSPSAGNPGDLNAQAPPAITSGDSTSGDSTSGASAWDRARQDPIGSALAILILALMLFSLVWVALFWKRHGLAPEASGEQASNQIDSWKTCAVPILALIGSGIAFYLAFIETTNTAAVCGPVGDCNTVQQSPYAVLFGVLPVGVLGLLGYLAILALWIWQRFFPSEQGQKAAWLLPAATYAGVLASAYLTFLEPFVIGAVCMWCLSSAVIMTLLLWLTYRPQAAPPFRHNGRAATDPA